MKKLRHKRGVTIAQAGEKPGLQVPTGLSSPCQLEGGGVEKVQMPHPRREPHLQGGVSGKSTALIPWSRGWKRGTPSCRGPSELCGGWALVPGTSLQPASGWAHPTSSNMEEKELWRWLFLGCSHREEDLGSGYLVFFTFSLKPEGQ